MAGHYSPRAAVDELEAREFAVVDNNRSTWPLTVEATSRTEVLAAIGRDYEITSELTWAGEGPYLYNLNPLPP